MRVSFFCFAIGLIVDQISKAWVRENFSVGEAWGYPWPGVFELTLSYNHGVAFGLFQGFGNLFVPLALFVAIWLLIHSYKHPELKLDMKVASGIVAAGAVGNMIDRVWLGKVTDMLWFRLINYPVFNIADSLICVGTGIFILNSFTKK